MSQFVRLTTYPFVQGKKAAKADPVEMGTQQDDVDYAWLPKETTTEFSEYKQVL